MRLWILYAHIEWEFECEKECKIILNGEEMEEVNELKYLGSVTCKHCSTEGETRERALQGRKVVASLGRNRKGRSVSMEVKRDLRNTVRSVSHCAAPPHAAGSQLFNHVTLCGDAACGVRRLRVRRAAAPRAARERLQYLYLF